MLGQHQMRAIQLPEQGKLSWPRLPTPVPHSVHVGPQRLGQRMVRRGSPQQWTAPCWRPRALSGPQPLSELEYHLLAKKGGEKWIVKKKKKSECYWYAENCSVDSTEVKHCYSWIRINDDDDQIKRCRGRTIGRTGKLRTGGMRSRTRKMRAP